MNATLRPNAGPPAFLQLAGHPLRWHLLRELAQSDRQVRELTNMLDTPQSLVSYHLARLRAGDLVGMRRSSADGRDAYYRIDLARCGELLAAAGGALHPGLALAPSATARTAGRPRRAHVLFLCTGNSSRSQMAEALLEHLSGGAIRAYSAGSHPKPLHPNAVRVMAQRGIDISGRTSKHMDRFAQKRFDRVITLCDKVREICPPFPGAVAAHWSMADPAAEGDTDETGYAAFERTADELEARIPFLIGELALHTERRNAR